MIVSRYLPAAVLACIAMTGVAACGTDSDSGGLAAVPTRTSTAAQSQAPQTEAGGAIAVGDFVIQPTYECLDKTPRQAIVTVGWTAPSATSVSVTLDGRVLSTGIQPTLPYQVPAGGAPGIGATVAFSCDGPTSHTLALTWSADGLKPNTRTATITEETGNV